MINVQNDISKFFGQARDQGQRPTCLAFTASDLNAFHNQTQHLSVEFLCHEAAKLVPNWQANIGFPLDAIFQAIDNPGQPEEYLYPYQILNITAPQLAPTNQFPNLYKGKVTREINNSLDVVNEISKGKAVGVIVAVTRSLFKPQNGIVAEDPHELPQQFHALVAVGTGTDPQTANQYILLRNSWGINWGNAGHAWVSCSYLDMHMVQGVIF